MAVNAYPALVNDDTPFPAVTEALADPNGLLAISKTITATRLLEAYPQGIFPWSNEGEPVMWWSPDPRMVLYPTEFIIHRSFAKILRQHDYKITYDQSFDKLIALCASEHQQRTGTWITKAYLAAFKELHAKGFAHSVEVWQQDILMGGLYGLLLGNIFFGESMVSLAANISKLALHYLTRKCIKENIMLIDCQIESAHLASLGARAISRSNFITHLQQS